MTELEYEVREQDLLAFNEHQLQYSQELMKAITRNQSMIPGFIGVIALFYWFYYQDVLTSFWIGIIGVSWGLVVPTYIRWNVLGRIRKSYSAEDKKNLLGSYTLREEPRALIEITPTGENRVEWPDVLRVEATKKYAFIFVDVNEALIIPKKTVKKGKWKNFINNINERIEKA